MTILFFIPLLILPFIISLLFKKLGAKHKFSYLIMAIVVPLYPLLLVQLGILPENGVVLAGTSVFAIPAILFLQYLANRLILAK